jgi:hypothetical protein
MIVKGDGLRARGCSEPDEKSDSSQQAPSELGDPAFRAEIAAFPLAIGRNARAC